MFTGEKAAGTLAGENVRLRALEPGDVDLLYGWENDPAVWEVSGTIAPYSRETLRRFIENQQYDIYRTRQARFVIERVSLPSEFPSRGGVARTDAVSESIACKQSLPSHEEETEGNAGVVVTDGQKCSNIKLPSLATRGGREADVVADTPVGLIDLFDFDPRNMRAAVGVVVYGDDDRRHGYGAEAVLLLENYARRVLGLHQIYCHVHADNMASINLFHSCGFTEAGVLRDWSHTAFGPWHDEIVFQKIFR